MTDDPNPEFERIRRNRNLVMALLLGAFVILVYLISMAKMG